ncbi:MAG: hypothetical protein NZM33_17210 [Bryobacteraceae bacterium]|nr:hypothetical protein [Bryobacteraceae bacterium]
MAAPLVAGAPKEVLATWEELPPLVEKRDIETVLLNGVHIRGRVEKVLPEALEIRVKHSSDPNLMPKGRTRVPRELVSAATVRWRRGPARALLVGGAVGYLRFLRPALDPAFDRREMGPAEANGIFFGMIATAYLIGRKLDAKAIRVCVLPQLQSGSEVWLVNRKEGGYESDEQVSSNLGNASNVSGSR